MPQNINVDPDTVIKNLIKSLPDKLLESRKFLLWKGWMNEETGKTRKVPYYVDGGQRQGALDSPDDIARLTTFDKAAAAFQSGQYSGIGYALTGDGIAAFDIDKCLSEKDNTQLVSGHAGSEIAFEALASGAYIEISPSGTGLRVLGKSNNRTAYSKGGLEYWGEKRFVTLTGNLWANPKGWVDIQPLRESINEKAEKERAEEYDFDPDGYFVTPRLLEDLRSALMAIEPHEREVWVKMGHALKGLDKQGRKLWDDWSRLSPKFDKDDADRVWNSLKPDRITYKSVFAEARDFWRWENPRSKKVYPEDEEPPIMSRNFEDLGDLVLNPTEFILDGFIPAGTSVIAGAWGAGKSTNLIPLYASIAHLTPEDWGFHPQLRRHVIWLTESPGQARDTLYSLCKLENGADWDTYKEYFHIRRARRTEIQKMAAILKSDVEDYKYHLDNGFQVSPVIVIDTTAANIEIENESDNSQVSKVMSVLKYELPGIPLTLIGHTPKALVKADVMDMSFRGAGAWEADAEATYFLVYDADTDSRFLAIRKCRFAPTYPEISFDTNQGTEVIPTPWGLPQTKTYLHGIPSMSSGAERKAAKAEAIQEKREQAHDETLSRIQREMLAEVERCFDDGLSGLITRTLILENVPGGQNLKVEVLKNLVASGRLLVYQGPKRPGQRGPSPLQYYTENFDIEKYQDE